MYITTRELDPCDGSLPRCNTAGPQDVPLDNIFINRTLEANTDFTQIERYNGTNTINRVILDMRFRVMCQQDYYGADCTRFCRPQNDSLNGYYTCNSDGSFRCLEGFRNPSNNCREGEPCLYFNCCRPYMHDCMMIAVILACDSSPCANNGSCTSIGAFDFICKCAVSYTGPTCEVDIDNCVSAICPSNSVCVDGINTFQCICLSGFKEVNGSCVLQTNTGLSTG